MKISLFLLIAVLSLFAREGKPVCIFMIGDSTMAKKKEKAAPETGWGQVLHLLFDERVAISNHAKNGRSSKSFIDEGLWQVVLDSLRRGDYVIIQFGHNDAKPDAARHTDPSTSYRKNLIKYIEESRGKGAIPILCTSIIRRKFKNGELTDTHGDYPDVVRAVAKEKNVPLLDLQRKTAALVADLGPENSKSLFLYTKPGEFANRPDGVEDDTHLNPEGAGRVAGLAVECIREQGIDLVKFLK